MVVIFRNFGNDHENASIVECANVQVYQGKCGFTNVVAHSDMTDVNGVERKVGDADFGFDSAEVYAGGVRVMHINKEKITY